MKWFPQRFQRTSRRFKAGEGAVLGVLAALLAFLVNGWGGLTPLENSTWDWRVALFAHASPHTDSIKYVELDQASLDWGKTNNAWSWPWPREVYAYLLKYLDRTTAKAVVFDVILSEPSVYSQEDDQSLREAITKTPHFVVAFQTGNLQSGFQSHSWPSTLAVPPWQVKGLAHLPADLHESLASFPLLSLATAAAALGDTKGLPDQDSLYRRVGLLWSFDGHAVPSLALAAYLSAHPRVQIHYRPGVLTLTNPQNQVERIPLDHQGRALLTYRGTWLQRAAERYPLWKLIRSELQIEAGQTPEVKPEVFQNSYVFLGFTALGLYDLKPSPLENKTPGVYIHGTALDNLLTGDFKAPVPNWASGMYLFVLGLAAGVVIRLCHNARQTLLTYALFLLVPLASAFALYPLGAWLPLVAPFGEVLFILLAGTVFNYAGEGRQKRFIKDAFAQYLSPVVIDRLIQNPELLNLGGEKRTLTILFSDVQGFTSISEKLTPEELTALLNRYLSAVTSVIYEMGGTIDKYEGDAVIAFWNAPLDLPDHARQAVLASLEYQRRLEALQSELTQMSGGHPVKARIGLNTGPVVIGNMGSQQRFNYTFFGDAGNLASRLEGLNKQFGTYLMVSEFTKQAVGSLPGVVFRELSRVAVVGKSEPVTVYEPLREREFQAKAETLKVFDQGREKFYEGKFEEALQLMETIATQDAPAAKYVEKLKQLREAPPASWNGVWLATEK